MFPTPTTIFEFIIKFFTGAFLFLLMMNRYSPRFASSSGSMPRLRINLCSSGLSFVQTAQPKRLGSFRRTTFLLLRMNSTWSCLWYFAFLSKTPMLPDMPRWSIKAPFSQVIRMYFPLLYIFLISE